MAWWETAKNPQYGGSLDETRASNSPAGLRLALGTPCCLPAPVATCPWEHWDPICPVLHPASSPLAPWGVLDDFGGFVGVVHPGGCEGSPVLTPCCHPAVFPQCRHLPEGAAGGGEAEEEGGEAEGDTQGPTHLPLTVGAVARGDLCLAAGATLAGCRVTRSLSAASGWCPAVPFPFVPWVLFCCLSLSFGRGQVVVPLVCPNRAGGS